MAFEAPLVLHGSAVLCTGRGQCLVQWIIGNPLERGVCPVLRYLPLPIERR